MALLGIFWWDVEARKLDGVYYDYEYNVPESTNGSQFFPTLHRDVWDERHADVVDQYGNVKPGCEDSLFAGEDYTMVPRGRVSADANGYQILAGEWIHDDYECVVSQVIETFMLPEDETEVVLDWHWDLGNGWGE